MLKVTNTSSKIVGFKGENGEMITVLPNSFKEVADSLSVAVKTLEDMGLVETETADGGIPGAAEKVAVSPKNEAEAKTVTSGRARSKKAKEVI